MNELHSTIGERLGAPKHGYMQPKYRAKETPRRDPEARRSLILAYIKEHDGEYIKETEFQKVAGMTGSVLHHLKKLQKAGKITIVAENLMRKRFYYGRAAKTGHRTNGDVIVTKPAAPVTKTGLEKLQQQSLAYLRTVKTEYSFADMARGVFGLLDSLEEELKPDNQPGKE